MIRNTASADSVVLPGLGSIPSSTQRFRAGLTKLVGPCGAGIVAPYAGGKLAQ